MKTIEKTENTGATNALDINEKKRLGAALKEFREGRHLNQEEMASVIGCTGQYVSDVERGKYCLSLKKYITLCDHFGASLDDLIFGKTGSYSEFDIRNRLLRQIDGMNVKQVEFIEEQIALMKKLFEA